MSGGGRRLATSVSAVTLAVAALTACSSGDDGARPDKETFCAKLAEFNAGTQAFDLNVADDAEVERIATLLEEIEASAPDEIRDDVEARFAYVDDVIAASRGDEEAQARLADAESTDEEQARIDEYAQRECGIVLEPPTTGVPTTSEVVPPTVATTVPTTSVPTTGAPPTSVATTAPPAA